MIVPARPNKATYWCRLEVDEDGPRYVFAGHGLGEERVERVVLGSWEDEMSECSSIPWVSSSGIMPSGWMPCSRQYNSQQALPIWTPAWPTWRETTSLWIRVDTDKRN